MTEALSSNLDQWATLVVVVTGCCWQPLKERTLNIPLFKEDFCSNIQGKQSGKLFGKSWKKISHQNEVETRLVQAGASDD